MSENISGLTRGGTEWQPAFVIELKQEKCIGCGRCFKVCPRDVFELVEREMCSADEDDDFDEDDTTIMVMSLKNQMDCIGCQSCSRVCPKKCHTHSAMPVMG
jgi:Nif-specific ferredoxin III